jgi:mono/diheme cytochrome c family protein
MKKIILLSGLALMIACKPKSTATKSTATAAPAASNEPTEAQLTAAKTKFPDATMEVLKKGHVIYYDGACIKCHGPKRIVTRDEKEWVGILDDMARKAHLSAEEKDAVWKYIMAVKLSAS